MTTTTFRESHNYEHAQFYNAKIGYILKKFNVTLSLRNSQAKPKHDSTPEYGIGVRKNK